MPFDHFMLATEAAERGNQEPSPRNANQRQIEQHNIMYNCSHNSGGCMAELNLFDQTPFSPDIGFSDFNLPKKNLN